MDLRFSSGSYVFERWTGNVARMEASSLVGSLTERDLSKKLYVDERIILKYKLKK